MPRPNGLVPHRSERSRIGHGQYAESNKSRRMNGPRTSPQPKPVVSVHMLTYNHTKYIAGAIEGVLQQRTDFPFELVIGDDCSTDGTREIVEAYAESFPEIIRVVTSESNVGMHENSDRVLSACVGEFIAWCEGDDCWTREDKLQIQVDYLRSNPDCVLVFSDYDLLNVLSGDYIKRYCQSRGLTPYGPPTIEDVLLGRCDIRTCTACASLSEVRAVYESDRELVSGRFLMRDTPLWVELIARKRGHWLSDTLALHRVLPESVSHSASALAQHRFHSSAHEMRLYLAKKHGLSSARVGHMEARLHDANLFLAFLNCDALAATKAWQCFPSPTLRQRLLFIAAQSELINFVVKRLWRAKNVVLMGWNRLSRSRLWSSVCA